MSDTVRSLEPRTASAPTRRERQRRETRERIFEAALEEFRRVGFAKAQIDPIVERAGVARGTFYFHFPSKDHVLLELQRRYEAEIVARLRAALETPPDSVRAFLHQMIEAVSAQRRVGDEALGREIMAMYVREQRPTVDASSNVFVVALVDFLADAQERGAVRTDMAPEDIATILLTTLFGFVLTSGDSLEERIEAFGRAVDVFARGIEP